MIALAVGLVVVACDDDIYVTSQSSAEIQKKTMVGDLLADGFELEHIDYTVGPNAFSPDGRKFVFAYSKYNDKIVDHGRVDANVLEKDYYTSTNIPEKNLEYKGVAIYDLDQGKVTYNYRLPNTILYIQEPSFNKTGTHIAFLVDYEQFRTGRQEYGFIFNTYKQYIWLHNELRPKQDLYIINIQQAEIQKHNISKHIEMPYITNAVPSPSGNKVALMPYIHWYKEWQAIQENSKLKKKKYGGLETMIWEVNLLQQQATPIVPQGLISERWTLQGLISARWPYTQKNHFLYMSENSIRTMVFYGIRDHHYICDFDTKTLPLKNTKKCLYENPMSALYEQDDLYGKFFADEESSFSADGKYILTFFTIDIPRDIGDDIFNGFIMSVEDIAEYNPFNIPESNIILICPKPSYRGFITCGHDQYDNLIKIKSPLVFTDKYILMEVFLGVSKTYKSVNLTFDDIIAKYKVFPHNVLGMYNVKTEKINYIRFGYSRNWLQTPHTVKDGYTISFPVIAEKWNLPYCGDVKSKDDLYYVKWDKINKIWVKSTKQINE